MASQESLFGRALLCHPILKFSHSTLPRNASPSRWNHIQAPDLFALIEQLDQGYIQLRVVQATADLEVLPLTDIIRETKDLHKRNPATRPDDLPIFGLTKGTALAIRYFCQDDQVRRIQLRFTADAACDEAVLLLSNHGLMFSMPSTKPVPQSTSRPATANSSLSQQHSVQSARFDRGTSSIIVPSIQDAFHSSSIHSQQQQQSDQHTFSQASVSHLNMFTSSSPPKEQQTRSIQRQPTFAPIRTSDKPSERPSTAPNQWQSDMTKDLLPPRRQLPFPKPSSSPAKAKMLPPLPKPKYASEVSQADVGDKEKDQNQASLENQFPTQKRITRLTTPQGPTRFEPPASRMYNFRANDDEMTVDNGTAVHSDATSATLPPEMKCTTLGDPDHLYRSSASPVHFASTNAGTEFLSSPERVGSSSPERMSSSSPLSRHSQRIAQMHQATDIEMTTAIPSHQAVQGDLRRYAEQDDDTRKDALVQFILASLEDEAFKTLCIDVEKCWQRQVLDRHA